MTTKTDREICEAATPGPWTDGYECNRIYIEDKQVGGEDPLATFDHPLLGDKENNANALFSCWYDPPKIHDMLDTIASLDARLAEMTEKAENANTPCIPALKRDKDKFRMALEGLTPGGSEYHNHPELCVQFVRDVRDRQHRVIDKFKKRADFLETRLDEMTARAEKAERHLESLTIRYHHNHDRGEKAEFENSRLTSVMCDIYSHLGAALTQSIDSDDRIIIDHVRDACELAKKG